MKRMNNARTVGNTTSSFYYITIIICLIGLFGADFFMFRSHQQSKEQMTEYSQLNDRQGYVGMKQAEDLFNRAVDSDNTDLIDKLDNSTVVDESNGHEYTAQVDGGGRAHYHIHFQPVINGSASVINPVWSKEHKPK